MTDETRLAAGLLLAFIDGDQASFDRICDEAGYALPYVTKVLLVLIRAIAPAAFAEANASFVTACAQQVDT